MDKYFPDTVVRDLTNIYYSKAERLMTNGSGFYRPNKSCEYLDTIRGALESAGLRSQPRFANIAAEFVGEGNYSFPMGAYSTTDRILDLVCNKRDNFKVLLNAMVTSLSEANNRVTVTTVINGKEYMFKAKKCVLSAGTIASPAIIMGSRGLDIERTKVGKGITDHDIWGIRFFVKKGDVTPPPIKIHIDCVEPKSGTPFLINMSINARHFLEKPFYLGPLGTGEYVCNIVYQFRADLVEDNLVTDDRSIKMTRSPHVSADQRAMMNTITDKIEEALGGCRREGATTRLGGLGVVAHEVGTLRMLINDSDGVVDKDLKLVGCSNIYVCDLSVFPVSPPANPSLTLAALALRLASHLDNI